MLHYTSLACGFQLFCESHLISLKGNDVTCCSCYSIYKKNLDKVSGNTSWFWKGFDHLCIWKKLPLAKKEQTDWNKFFLFFSVNNFCDKPLHEASLCLLLFGMLFYFTCPLLNRGQSFGSIAPFMEHVGVWYVAQGPFRHNRNPQSQPHDPLTAELQPDKCSLQYIWLILHGLKGNFVARRPTLTLICAFQKCFPLVELIVKIA